LGRPGAGKPEVMKLRAWGEVVIVVEREGGSVERGWKLDLVDGEMALHLVVPLSFYLVGLS
jgi:hypothetical protein